MTNKHESMIDKVIDDFKFERVFIAMTALDWQWPTTEGNGQAVPTLTKIKAMAREMLKDSIEHKDMYFGGFKAIYRNSPDHKVEYFALTFSLDYADSFDND